MSRLLYYIKIPCISIHICMGSNFNIFIFFVGYLNVRHIVTYTLINYKKSINKNNSNNKLKSHLKYFIKYKHKISQKLKSYSMILIFVIFYVYIL